jgi:YfiR/HmsC-like
MKPWITAIACLSVGSLVAAQDALERRASTLIKIAQFVAWPTGSIPADQFVLCFAGNVKAAEGLGALNGRRLQGRVLHVQKITSASDALACQMLYLPADDFDAQAYISAVAMRPILSVSDRKDFLLAGGKFALRDNGRSDAIAVNVDATQRAGLRVNARLLEVAQLSHGVPAGQ